MPAVQSKHAAAAVATAAASGAPLSALITSLGLLLCGAVYGRYWYKIHIKEMIALGKREERGRERRGWVGGEGEDEAKSIAHYNSLPFTCFCCCRQCVSCEQPDSSIRQCRGCQVKIHCCDKCWPRYQRDVHSQVCEDLAAANRASSTVNMNLNDRFVFDSTRPITHPPCRVCGGPASKTCRGCNQVHYCDSTIRQCVLTDWPTHRHSCKSVELVQMQPQNTQSIMESPLPVDLLAHVESFLTFFQWSQCAQVNHAWRNASLLPSGASHQLFVTNRLDSASSFLGPYARRSFRRLQHINFAPATALDIAIRSKSLPHLSHLQELNFLDHSHPYHRDGMIGEYAASMSSTLRSLSVSSEAFGSISRLTALSQLRELHLHDVPLTNELNHALSQLVHLELLSATPRVSADSQSEVGQEDYRLFKELVNILSRLKQLRRLQLEPITECHRGDDPITQLMSNESPKFSRVTHFFYRCNSANLNVITRIRQLGQKFPALKKFSFEQMWREEVMPQAMEAQWLEEFQSYFHEALDSVRQTLTHLTLIWPFDEPLKFTATSELAIRFESVSVHRSPLGRPLFYAQPETFMSSFVQPLQNLKCVELNFNSESIISEYTSFMITPLVHLVHLEKLSIDNLGLVGTHEGQQWNYRALQAAFMKQRDEHRSLKFVNVRSTLLHDQPGADLYVSLQIFLTLLPRVDVLRCTSAHVSIESLFRLARDRPIVWRPQLESTHTGAQSRLVHLQTLPLDRNYLTSSDDFTGFKLRNPLEWIKSKWWRQRPITASRPHPFSNDGIASALESLTVDYTISLFHQLVGDALTPLSQFAWSRCQQLEMTHIHFTSYSPYLREVDQLDSLLQLIFMEFAGLWRDEIFSTTHTTSERDITRKNELFCVMREMQ